MDILAHTLWANIMAKEANELAEKKNKKFYLSVGWTAFWGVFPDLFAFSISFILIFYRMIFERVPFSSFMDHHELFGGLDFASFLYQYSHSLIIWVFVFFIIWVFYKRPRYELLGWLLHILIDIPSHSLSFFPTPFLFPISGYVFPYGVQWSNIWFMLINYSLLLVIWGRFFLKDLFAKKVNKN